MVKYRLGRESGGGFSYQAPHGLARLRMRLLIEHGYAVRVDVVLHNVQLNVVLIVLDLDLLVRIQNLHLRQLELLVQGD